MKCQEQEFVGFAMGLSLGVAIVLAVMYLSLQDSDKRLAVKLATQDLYFLLEEHFSDLEIGRVISKNASGYVSPNVIAVHFGQTMFSLGDESAIKTKMTKVRWAIFRYWWSVERRLRRRGASISKILDMRMVEQYD